MRQPDIEGWIFHYNIYTCVHINIVATYYSFTWFTFLFSSLIYSFHSKMKIFRKRTSICVCIYISIILPLPLYKGTYKFIYFDKSHSTNVKSRHQLIAFIQPFNRLTKRSFHTCAYLCVYANARSQCLMLNKFINHMKKFSI